MTHPRVNKNLSTSFDGIDRSVDPRGSLLGSALSVPIAPMSPDLIEMGLRLMWEQMSRSRHPATLLVPASHPGYMLAPLHRESSDASGGDSK